MDLGLKGRTALITGASQGIGAGLAEAFAEEGVSLRLTARSRDKLERVREGILAKHAVEVSIHPLDLTRQGAAEALAEEAGDVDILVNNAGVIPGGNLFAIDEAAWRAGWELKVFGYINLTRLIYPKMVARGRGVIVNDIGNAGERFDRDYIAGTAGNASLMAFTRALGAHSIDEGVRVVGVNPGPVDTDRIYKLLRRRALDWLGDEERWPELARTYPLGRPATVREVSDLILFLASDRASYISGTIVTIDGGIASRASII